MPNCIIFFPSNFKATKVCKATYKDWQDFNAVKAQTQTALRPHRYVGQLWANPSTVDKNVHGLFFAIHKFFLHFKRF